MMVLVPPMKVELCCAVDILQATIAHIKFAFGVDLNCKLYIGVIPRKHLQIENELSHKEYSML
jgi:hypothetical protein